MCWLSHVSACLSVCLSVPYEGTKTVLLTFALKMCLWVRKQEKDSPKLMYNYTETDRPPKRQESYRC